MIKRCGNIRAWHFAHDYRYENENSVKCSYESYLHAFAKLRLKQWFEESDSIFLHYLQPTSCKFTNNCMWKTFGKECTIHLEEKIDLKKCLTRCELEETVYVDEGRFRADLLWSNPKKTENDILVEIKVTHECTQKKKDSHKRIIEFEVHSEEDVENIVSNDIRESDTVRFYGFTPKIIYKKMPPKYTLSKFLFYRTGKAFSRHECNCQTFMDRNEHALLELTIEKISNFNYGFTLPKWLRDSKDISYGRFYNWGLAVAKSKGNDVRSCYYCNHRHYDFDKNELTCVLKPNVSCDATNAIACGEYVFNENYCRRNLDEFIKYSQNHVVDVWSKT